MTTRTLTTGPNDYATSKVCYACKNTDHELKKMSRMKKRGSLNRSEGILNPVFIMRVALSVEPFHQNLLKIRLVS